MLKAKVYSFQKQNLLLVQSTISVYCRNAIQASQGAAESEVTGVQAKNAMSLQCLKLWERKKSQGTAVVACSGSGRSTEL